MGSISNDAAGLDWGVLKDTRALRLAAGVLTFWAGAINGVASMALVFGRVSHMSGRVIDQGLFLLNNPLGALFISTLIFSFFAGTIIGGYTLPRFKLTRALLLATVPIFVAVLMGHFGIQGSSAKSFEGGRFVMAFLLSLGMGMQNSVTSQTRIGRTTHMTGEITDLGVCIAKGNWPRALFLATKYLAFFAGALLSYVGVAYSPLLTLLLAATGIVVTGLFYQRWDDSAAKIDPKKQVFR